MLSADNSSASSACPWRCLCQSCVLAGPLPAFPSLHLLTLSPASRPGRQNGLLGSATEEQNSYLRCREQAAFFLFEQKSDGVLVGRGLPTCPTPSSVTAPWSQPSWTVTHTHTHLYTHMLILTFTYLIKHSNTLVYSHLYTCTSMYSHALRHTCTNVHVLMCTHYVLIHIHTHTCAHIHIHTCTHTEILPSIQT